MSAARPQLLRTKLLRVVLLTTQSMVLSTRPATSGLDFTALLDELAKQLDGALKP